MVRRNRRFPRETLRNLVAQASSGSEEAISEIIAKYGTLVLRVVRNIMPPGDPVRDILDSLDVQQ